MYSIFFPVAQNEIYELITVLRWPGKIYSLWQNRADLRGFLFAPLSWIITFRENNVNIVNCDNIVIFADVKQTPHILPGYLLFKDFCETVAEEPIPQLRFYEEVRVFSPHTI